MVEGCHPNHKKGNFTSTTNGNSPGGRLLGGGSPNRNPFEGPPLNPFDGAY